MNDLWYQVALGSGHTVIENKILSNHTAINDDINNFNIFMFGQPNFSSTNKSFLCRNFLASIKGFYVGKNRGDHRAAHIDNAVSYLSNDLPNSQNKNFVIIEGIGYGINISDIDSLNDEDAEDIELLLINLFSIIRKTVQENYNAEHMVIYWYLSEEELNLVKSFKFFDDSYELIDDGNHSALIRQF